MIVPHELREGLDIETRASYGYAEEFALQPWRVMEGKAEVSCIGMGRADGQSKLVTGGYGELLRQQRGRPTVTWNGVFDTAFLIAAGHYNEVNEIPWFDAMLLWKWHENGQVKEQLPRWSLEDGAKRWLKDWPHLQAFLEMKKTEVHAGVNDAYWETRGKLDAVVTGMIAQRIWERLSERKRRSATIEARCIVPIARSWVMGVPMDLDAVADAAPHIVGEMREIEAKLGTTKEVLASSKQLGDLLFNHWGLTPIEGMVSEKTGVPSTDKKHLTYLAEADDRVLTILRWRELSVRNSKFIEGPKKAAEYLGCNVVHPSPKLFSTYCVPGDVEVLTKTGWVPLETWEGGDIAQVTGDSCDIEFLPASKFIGPIVNDWISVKHQKIDCLFTHGHTIGYYSQLGKWVSKPAAEAFSESQVTIPLSGVWSGVPTYTADQSRFICAVHADGYLGPEGTIKFTFKKHRKITRMRALLSALDLPYREYVCKAYPDRVEIKVRRADVPTWLPPSCKKLGSWVLAVDRDAFLDEIVHWDGSHHVDGGVEFSSAKKADVDWVLTLAALSGRKAGRHKDYHGKHGVMFTCHISTQRPVAQIRHKHTSTVSASQRAYCAETQTGFWLARSHGKIFITGNTGRMTYQSKTKKKFPTGVALHQWQRNQQVRTLINPPPGYVLVEFDASGQEDRLMAQISQDPMLIKIFRDDMDIHCYTAASITGRGYDELMQLKAADDPWLTGDKGMRQAGKVTNHSNKYRIGAKKMRITAKVDYGLDISIPEAKKWQQGFKRSFPGVPRYWDNAINSAKRLGFAETLAGRTFLTPESFFNNQKTQWGTQSSAINFPIQGSGADMKELAIAEMHERFPEMLFAFDLHDGLFFYVKQGTPIELLHEAQHALDNLDYESAWGLTPAVPFTWDAEFGPDWGHMTKLHKAKQEFL